MAGLGSSILLLSRSQHRLKSDLIAYVVNVPEAAGAAAVKRISCALVWKAVVGHDAS